MDGSGDSAEWKWIWECGGGEPKSPGMIPARFAEALGCYSVSAPSTALCRGVGNFLIQFAGDLGSVDRDHVMQDRVPCGNGGP